MPVKWSVANDKIILIALPRLTFSLPSCTWNHDTSEISKEEQVNGQSSLNIPLNPHLKKQHLSLHSSLAVDPNLTECGSFWSIASWEFPLLLQVNESCCSVHLNLYPVLELYHALDRNKKSDPATSQCWWWLLSYSLFPFYDNCGFWSIQGPSGKGEQQGMGKSFGLWVTSTISSGPGWERKLFS